MKGNVYLVGLMGAGKTTVGRLLAERTGRPFLDSDQAIERDTGRTVAEIFATDGEAAFRSLETQVLRDMLDRDEPAVIAAAGGTVLDATNRARMRARGTVVWLRVDPALLPERVHGSIHRPLLADDPAAAALHHLPKQLRFGGDLIGPQHADFLVGSHSDVHRLLEPVDGEGFDCGEHTGE